MSGKVFTVEHGWSGKEALMGTRTGGQILDTLHLISRWSKFPYPSYCPCL